MTAKQQAIKDIKESLKSEGKSFIAFRTELNDAIQRIVNNQLKEQRKKSKSSFCGLAISK